MKIYVNVKTVERQFVKYTTGWFAKYTAGDFSLQNEPRWRSENAIDNNVGREIMENNQRQIAREMAFQTQVRHSTIICHLT